MGVSLRHLLAVQSFVSNGRVVAVSQGHVWTYEANCGLSPCCMASLNGRAFHDFAHKVHNLRASLEPHAERIEPIRFFRVISCQNGSVKAFPALLPVANDRPNCRLIFGSSNLSRCSLLRCRWSGLRRGQACYDCQQSQSQSNDRQNAFHGRRVYRRPAQPATKSLRLAH